MNQKVFNKLPGLKFFSLTLVLILIISYPIIQSYPIEQQTPSWMEVGKYAEYENFGVSWLLVKNTTSDSGLLVRKNESRLIYLNQSMDAIFRWTCISITDDYISLNLSLQMPSPFGSKSKILFVSKSTREMSIDNENVGRTPFWIHHLTMEKLFKLAWLQEC